MMKLCNIICAFLLTNLVCAAQAADDEPFEITDKQGKVVGSYAKSYALLIGNSDYQAWQPLTQVSTVIERVAGTLEKQGFQVVKHFNLTTQQFETTIEKFIHDYGMQPENRLLFFFAGHSYIHFLSQNGYLITTDTPLPEQGQFKFLKKAIVIDKFMNWAEKIQSTHTLFIFDNCLTSSSLNTTAITPQPIDQQTMLPTRYFITACGKDEIQPTEDMFSRIFTNALQYGWGDMDADGYVTGTELAHYIQQELPQKTHQTPQIGTMKNSTLAKGNFVFKAAHETVNKEDAQLFTMIEEEIAPVMVEAVAEPTTITDELIADSSEPHEIMTAEVVDKITTETTVEQPIETITKPSTEETQSITEVVEVKPNAEPIEVVDNSNTEQPVESVEIQSTETQPDKENIETISTENTVSPAVVVEETVTPDSTNETVTMTTEESMTTPKVEDNTEETPVTDKTETVQPTSEEGYVLHTITKNDSLWNIALATLPKKGMNIDKHMKRIHQLNPHAFIKNNINLLIEGQVLQIPTTEE